MISRNANASLIALLLAGCGGGGGSNPTEVSANAPAPPAATTLSPDSAALVLAPVVAPAPQASAPTPAPASTEPNAPSTAPPQAPTTVPESKTVSGAEIQRALDNGVAYSEEFPANAALGPAGIVWWYYSHMRRVYSATGEPLTIYTTANTTRSGGALSEIAFNHPVQLRRMDLESERTGQSINVKQANGMIFPAIYLSLDRNIELDQVAGEWRNGEWFVRLLPQSMTGRSDAFRVCWLTYLPNPAQSHFVSNETVTIPAGPPINRLTCSKHRRSDGKDIGARIIDDVSGAVTTYSAEW